MQKINLDEFIDDMPFACSQYRTKIKHQLLEFGKQVLELAAKNARGKILPVTETGVLNYSEVDKQSILDTIKQVE